MTRQTSGAAKFIAYLLVVVPPTGFVPFVFWLGGMEFGRRGPVQAICAILTILMSAIATIFFAAIHDPRFAQQQIERQLELEEWGERQRRERRQAAIDELRGHTSRLSSDPSSSGSSANGDSDQPS